VPVQSRSRHDLEWDPKRIDRDDVRAGGRDDWPGWQSLWKNQASRGRRF
jgi:hypothetical protein